MAQMLGVFVAPHVGAWIEILVETRSNGLILVAPHVGAWIEIRNYGFSSCVLLVAPHVGAWIEIIAIAPLAQTPQSHLT